MNQNKNNKIIGLYEKIKNNEGLLQSLKTGEIFVCSRCQDFKRPDEFTKNQRWCKVCMKTTVNNDFKICECGKKIYLRCYSNHLLSKYHIKRLDNISKENISPK